MKTTTINIKGPLLGALVISDGQGQSTKELEDSVSKAIIDAVNEATQKLNKKEGPVTERIKTFEDACEECPPSDNASILLAYNGIDSDMIGAKAMVILSIIVRALNEGWTPDWKDSNQCKYYPYFVAKGAGFGFSDTCYVYWCTRASCGSRLCFKSRELAEYAGKQFESIYNDFLTVK